MNKLMLWGTLVALIAGPASAADLPRKAPPPEPAPICIWCGFYIGINGGFGEARVNTRFNTDGFFNDFPGDRIRENASGGMFGGQAGYNWQWGSNWLFGLEISGDWTGIKKTVVSPFFPLTDSFEGKVNWIFTFTPRLGVTSGNWLLYVKGGLAVADFTATFRSTDFVPTLFIERSDTRTGWTVGGGVEVLTGATWPFGGSSGSWVFGIEGNYYDFGRVHELFTVPVISNHDHDITMWSVLGRLSWKFGGPSVAARY